MAKRVYASMKTNKEINKKQEMKRIIANRVERGEKREKRGEKWEREEGRVRRKF